MNAGLREVLGRCDRSLVLMLGIVLATLSAGAGVVSAARPPAESVITVRVPETVVRIVRTPMIVPRAPGPVSPDAARSTLLAEHLCLTEVMYFEARGEGESGEKAVAEVVFHRLSSGDYANSICAVVNEGAARGRCQFSFACDGSRDRPKSAAAWRSAEVLAARLLTGEESLGDATHGAVNYHAVYVRPVWASAFVRTAQIGNHVFYRRSGGADEVALRGALW